MSTPATHDGLVPLGFNFETAIRQHCAANGLTVTDEETAAIDAEMKVLGTHDPATGGFSFLLQTGQDGNVVDYLAQATARLPKAEKAAPEPIADSDTKPGWVKVRIGNGAHWRRSDDPMLRIMQSLQTETTAR